MATPPEFPTSANPDEKMNQEKSSSSSSSSSSSVDTTASKLSLGLVTKPRTARRRASLHQRSASDSLVLLKKPISFDDQGSKGKGCLKLHAGDADADADGNAMDPNIDSLDDSSSDSHGQSFDPNMDPKKMKRLLANRVSAQKSRLKKLDYIEKLKKDLITQQARVSKLAPQVAYYGLKRMLLQKENTAMKQRMEVLEKEKAVKEAETQALKDERDMLALTYFLMQEGI